jgi:hypothetical protein
MPPAEMQRLFGFVFESAILSSNLFCHRQDLPLPMGNHQGDAGELQTKSWESLWIDTGGEG